VTTSNGGTDKAFNGKVLNVNLTKGETTAEHLPDSMYRKYLGGYGLGARMLLDRVPKGADPLGPDNMLGIFPGLMTGTPLFGQRYQAVCKSPLTGGWGDANCGGDTGPFLKHAGWDGIMFFGISSKPVYLLIQDDKVSIEDASDLWGKNAIEAEEMLKQRHGKKASVADIGQAGETLSLISGICNDHGRLAARSGVGAVMGSKKLKAIVIVPSRNIMMAKQRYAGRRKDRPFRVREADGRLLPNVRHDRHHRHVRPQRRLAGEELGRRGHGRVRGRCRPAGYRRQRKDGKALRVLALPARLRRRVEGVR